MELPTYDSTDTLSTYVGTLRYIILAKVHAYLCVAVPLQHLKYPGSVGAYICRIPTYLHSKQLSRYSMHLRRVSGTGTWCEN